MRVLGRIRLAERLVASVIESVSCSWGERAIGAVIEESSGSEAVFAVMGVASRLRA